jgi:SAM-dependent methyltransferase
LRCVPYDLALFEELEAEYASRPTKKPVPRDPESRQEKARKRLTTMERELGVPMAGARVLELGCGHGWQTRFLVEIGGASEAVGVDIRSYPAWTETSGLDGVRLVEADMATEPVVPDGSLDLLVSSVVFEHVNRPVAMLAAVKAALRPGGKAWLHFNLYRGPAASHRYNEVHFPWPHLLFEDHVCVEWYAKHTGTPRPFAWVNHLTLAEYLAVAGELGLEVELCRRRVTPIDLGFYQRFQSKLGRYPALDLETDFATLVLRRPAEGPALRLGPAAAPVRLDYVERQRALDEALAAA